VLNLYRHLHPHDPELEAAAVGPVWSKLLASGFMTVIVAQATERLVSSCTLAIVPNLTRGGRSYGVIENVVTPRRPPTAFSNPERMYRNNALSQQRALT